MHGKIRLTNFVNYVIFNKLGGGNMILDMRKILEYEKEKWINIQRHPLFDISILKYSIHTVYDGKWDELTLLCRGIWIDSSGEVLARPFDKFFNHSEKYAIEEFTKKKESGMKYSVTNKLDGSLIIASIVKDKIIVSSSGSFTSTQAQKAEELVYILGYDKFFEKGKTYIFEYIAPTNKIVVSYGDRISLSLLAIRDTNTGIFLPQDKRFDCVENVDITIEEIEKEIECAEYINKEGYVIKFEDESMYKCKYEKYMELHKLVSGINETFIYENVKAGNPWEEILKNAPDEMFAWAEKVAQDIKYDWKDIYEKANAIYNEIPSEIKINKKEFALYVIKNYNEIKHLLFGVNNGKDISEDIWKMVKPKKNTKFGCGE
jgi:RNA ligase